MNVVGRDETEAGAFPAHERLEPADHAGVGLDERLAEEPQLVARRRPGGDAASSATCVVTHCCMASSNSS